MRRQHDEGKAWLALDDHRRAVCFQELELFEGVAPLVNAMQEEQQGPTFVSVLLIALRQEQEVVQARLSALEGVGLLAGLDLYSRAGTRMPPGRAVRWPGQGSSRLCDGIARLYASCSLALYHAHQSSSRRPSGNLIRILVHGKDSLQEYREQCNEGGQQLAFHLPVFSFRVVPPAIGCLRGTISLNLIADTVSIPVETMRDATDDSDAAAGDTVQARCRPRHQWTVPVDQGQWMLGSEGAFSIH